jgi:hypothetical protein
MNKTILGLTALAIGTGVIFTTATSASAYRGDPAVTGPNYTAERHEAMEKAFENKDFSQWLTLMQGKGRVTQVINKDNFAKFAEAHELAEDGKLVEANQIRTELGLNQHNGTGNGNRMGRNGR